MGGCIGEIQRWTAAQKKNRLEVRGPLVPYPQNTFAPSKTALVPFLSPFRLPFFMSFVPIEYKAKQSKSRSYTSFLTYLTKGNKVSFPGLWIGFSQRHSFLFIMLWRVTGECFQRRPSRVSGSLRHWSSLSSSYQTKEVTIKQRALISLVIVKSS